MRCDACQEIFCKDHITYANHKCTSSYKKVKDTIIYLFITITEMTEYHAKRTIYIKSMALLSYLSLNDYLIL